MSWFSIAIVIVAVSFLYRASGRGRECRKGRFPWFTVAVILGTVFAVRAYRSAHMTWTIDDDRMHIAGLTEHGRSGSHSQFPDVKQEDLWALRGGDKSAVSEPIKNGIPFVRPVKPASARQPPKAVSPDVARSVAEAKSLAASAKAVAMSFFRRAGSDTAELTGKSINKDAPQADETAKADKAAETEASVEKTDEPPAPVATAPAAEPASSAKALFGHDQGDSAKLGSAPAAVAPTTAAKADKAAPQWVSAAAGRERDIYYTKVTVGPYKSARECEEELPAELQKAARAYVDGYLGPGASQTFSIPQSFIHDSVVKEIYQESIDTSVGPMINLHARLAFDNRVRAQIHRMWRDAQVENRLLGVAAGAGLVLTILGAVFGYLKLDTLTRGYYTRRLLFGTVAVILACVGVAVLLIAIFTPIRVEHGMPATVGGPTSEAVWRVGGAEGKS